MTGSVALPRRAIVGLVALTVVVLSAITLGAHRVGDYHTETDFYGAYAEGARHIQRGHVEPARYGVVGPVYECALALVGWIVPDLWWAAVLISMASAAATLLWVHGLLETRADGRLALWTTTFLAANPTFLRYGYSVTTDSLGLALQAAAWWAMLGRKGRRAPWLAGTVSGLAVLTRYNAIYLVPGAMLVYLWLVPPSDGRRRLAAASFLAGFVLVVGPWLLLAWRAGAMPGNQLFQNVAYDVYAAPRGIPWDEYGAHLQPGFQSLWDVLRRDPGAVARRELDNMAGHLRGSITTLVGIPVAIVCALGLVLSIKNRTWPRLAPVWVLGLLLFLTLVPAFYSDRYALPLAPLCLTLAGAAAGSPTLARWRWGRRLSLSWLVALVPLALSVRASAVQQRQVLEELPVESRVVGEVLRRASPGGQRVLTRKPHVAYYGGLQPVSFPVVQGLSELADFCRKERVDFVYYSWVESRARPFFWFLLDTSATVPGLTPLASVAHLPAAAYRVGPRFGAEPPWLRDDSLRVLHERRTLERLPRAWVWRGHFALAISDLRPRPAEALEHLRAVIRSRPDFPVAWRMAGDAEVYLGRWDAAANHYARTLKISPGDLSARLSLGWLMARSGRFAEAADHWRPIAAQVKDPGMLQAMLEVFTRAGDEAGARAARRSLDEIRRQPGP